ncbi:MAG: tetratricopeptide repeat protein [Chlorobi bacterium]|nr:tetratricopeptide repeat protein [Chlorobiota bacterium]
MAKKKDNTEERIVAVEEALSSSEQFIEKNQQILTYIVGAIILIILAFFGYKKYVMAPKEKAAEVAIFNAQYYFEQDSLDLALDGDGVNLGFLEIIDDYGSTKEGNLAKYYAGICYLNKGEYETAIEYLKKFSSDDQVLSSMALGAIGDSYMQLGDADKAVDYYIKAANKNKNDFVTPAFLVKAGWSYEIMGNWQKALDTYEGIKKEFPKAKESRDMDKYIARAKANLGEL